MTQDNDNQRKINHNISTLIIHFRSFAVAARLYPYSLLSYATHRVSYTLTAELSTLFAHCTRNFQYYNVLRPSQMINKIIYTWWHTQIQESNVTNSDIPARWKCLVPLTLGKFFFYLHATEKLWEREDGSLEFQLKNSKVSEGPIGSVRWITC